MSGRRRISDSASWSVPQPGATDPVEELRAVLQPYVGTPLSREDSEEAAGNLLALFRLMNRWRDDAVLRAPDPPLTDLPPQPRPRRKGKQAHG